MTRSASLVCLILLAGAVAPAPAQETPDQQARRLLENGRAYRADGKLKQALENFNIVVTSFPGTDSVGEAQLEIGRYRMEVDRDPDKARAAFEQVTREHARSDAAPGAYYYLGLLTLSHATSPAELEDALAQFKRVETLYPRSVWVPRALQASALALRKAGRYDEAVDLNRRVALEYPASDVAAVAQYEIGQAFALQGEAHQAMEEFQRVRNRFPQSPWAERALERTTALYRLFGGASPVFKEDPSFSLTGGDVLKDVRAITVAPDGVLWVASEKTKSVVPFSPAGQPGQSLFAQDPRALSLASSGEIVLAAETAVRIGEKDVRSFTTPPDKPGGTPEPVDHVLSAVQTPGGALLVADDKRDRILRYDTDGRYLGTFPDRDAAKRKVTRMLVDGEGEIVTLDKDERVVGVWNEAGRSLRTLGPGGFKKPADVAVDPFRNLYVADEELGILVFDPSGRSLVKIGGPELRRPTALTLDATGAVLVYDDRQERILRYR